MKTTLCTLYNSLYLDKGLVLLDSLKECASDFELYVLCMDDKCYEVLSDIGEEKLKPIPLKDVENDAMLLAKNNRSMAEYCWTCSSRLIQYILATFNPANCTYIDADMYFYQDPKILVDEMISEGKSVMIVPHRFSKRLESQAKTVGTYCVEFNCFKNDAHGIKVLNHWHKQCLDCCSNLGDGIHWGDQKYLDEWPTLFPDIVHVCKHPGAGIAPWNVEWYYNINKEDKSVSYKLTDERINTIFYHFQSVVYIKRKEISTDIIDHNKDIDYNMVDGFYIEYLNKIEKAKQYLEKNYNLVFLIKYHPSQSVATWKRFLKKFAMIRFMSRLIKNNNTSYIVHL